MYLGTPSPTATTAYEQEALDFWLAYGDGLSGIQIETSGSTGKPKSIYLTREKLRHSALATGKYFGLNKGDTAICCLNIKYIAGKMMLIRAYELGLILKVVEPKANPLLPNEQFDFAAFVPLQLKAILDNDPSVFSNWANTKAILIGGAAISISLEKKIKELAPPFYSTFGMTETVSHVAVRRLNGESPTEAYHFLEGIEGRKAEDNCLEIRGFVTDNQWLSTNDNVDFVSENSFLFLGRTDNVINSGGVKIQLESVEKAAENALYSLGLSVRLFAWGFPDERLGEKLVLFIENQEIAPKSFTKLKKLIASELPAFHQPQNYYFLKTFFDTPTAKINKHQTVLNHPKN